MTQTIHTHCLDAASDLSPELTAAIQQVGPIDFAPDQSVPLHIRLARSVAGQQLSVKAAKSIWTRVEALAIERELEVLFHEDHHERLRGCGLSGAKVKTLCAIGAERRAGGLCPIKLGDMTPQERADTLTQLWGVGQWTADMINMFYFGEPDIWPDGDVAARKTLTRLTSPRRKTVLTARRFAPYRSWLAMYMWRWLDAVPDS